MRIASERAFLSLVDAYFPNRHDRVPVMRGDDAAVLDCPARLCLTTDLFLEGSHFRRDYFTPGEIGRKALAVNVSDAAAMGARPVGFSLGLMGPGDMDASFWEGVFKGMAALAARFDLPLVGGDVNRAPLVGLAVTLWAEAGASGRFLCRRCRAGDVLFLVGPVGLARVGLQVLERSGRHAETEWPRACAAHLRPEPLVEQGLALADVPGVRGLMDVSDGLALDLPRFLGGLDGGLGAELDIEPGELPGEVRTFAAARGLDPVGEAFAGGEDFALLGAADPQTAEEVVRAVPGARRIGRVLDRPGVVLNGRPAPGGGFDHFSG